MRKKYLLVFFLSSIVLTILFVTRDQFSRYVKDYLKSHSNSTTVRKFEQFVYYVFALVHTPHTGIEIGDGGLPTNAVLNDPTGIYVDDNGNIFFSERRHHRIRKISQGIISTVAGNGRSGFSGDGKMASQASIHYPEGLVGDVYGNLFVADSKNHRIRKISSNGIISTIAGIGEPGFSGDGGHAIKAKLYDPFDICIDGSGVLYVADWGNHRIRRITPDGIITTVAGTGQPGFSGDDGPAIMAKLNEPYGIAIDNSGSIYVADSGNHRVRKISNDENITTIAGTGVAGFSGDGGRAEKAQLNSPQAIFVNSKNEIYINDEHNHRIRKISQNGIIETVVGNGKPGYIGDGGLATKASLNDPENLWIDALGNIYLTDGDNNLVRKVDTVGIIHTIAGGGVYDK